MQKRDLYYERIPTKLLRDDVRYLGNILGKVIKEQEGKNFFTLVEKIRILSKANNTSLNTKQTNRKVIKAIQDLDPKNTFKLTRAFTHFMNFINLAELIDASRSLNEYENNRKKISNKNIFIEEIFVTTAKKSINKLELRKYLFSGSLFSVKSNVRGLTQKNLF